MSSILDTIKKMLGVETDVDVFDTDIIVHINSALMTLNQLGVGPADSFFISDNTAEWDDFFGTVTELELVKSYIYLKVKMLFDTPTSSTVVEAMTRQITEFEWRLTAQVEKNIIPVEEVVDE
ncbi:MAG: Structural protein [Candidatus Moranbacteria bacterium GW2011_GWF1_36_4]|nr:MAG: Structural protein [Candidatus Moranbacteria bacterium GW2011_GWF1_36_4]HAQ02994.1 hypothetical protein [Candidatus Nomurabacteria bacterium]